ncbi:hypothetical protein FCV25MIE_17451, partial [Fagus crenata]
MSGGSGPRNDHAGELVVVRGPTVNGVMWSDVDGGFLGGWWWFRWICGGELTEEIGGGY